MAKLPPKKPAAVKPENHERWVISYADLLTLLLATFVVLYASSTRNHHKEDEIAEAFVQAFHGTPPTVPVTTPSGSRGILQHQDSPIPKPVEAPNTAKLPKEVAHKVADSMKALQAMQLKLTTLFQPMIDKHQVTMQNAPLQLTIQLDASVLFPSGEAQLKPEAVTLLTQVAQGFTGLPDGFTIVVQGYTDNQPIVTADFPNNWALSAARAVTVVSLFQGTGVSGSQLAAEGFGEFQPVADNATDAGRAQNRRVVVVVRAPEPDGGSTQMPQGGEPAGGGHG
jgi:chemotaxis protein MotB